MLGSGFTTEETREESMKIIERSYNTKEHGIAGFLAYPERKEPGPALFLIHPKGGLGEYIKTETRKFAKQGYSTFAINVFEQLGYPAATHIETGSQIQAKTTDPEFTHVLTEGWRHLLAQPHVNKEESRYAVIAWVAASPYILSPQHRRCALLSAIIRLCATNPKPSYGRFTRRKRRERFVSRRSFYTAPRM